MNTQRKTGNQAIGEVVNPGKAFQLYEVRIHLSAVGGAGVLSVTLDANAGAEYDTVLMSQDMTAIADLVWQPDFPINFDNGDQIIVAWDNAGGKTYGLEVKIN